MFKASDYLSLLQQLEQFFEQSASGDAVCNALSPDQLRERLPITLPAEGKPLQALNAEIANYLSHAVKTAHPAYFNQLWGGFNGACFLGEMLTSATNTSMYTHEVAPVATLIEKALVAKFRKLVGFTHAEEQFTEGQFTTGGSNGNLMALAMARHRAVPTLKQTGLSNAPKLVAFVSQEAHYSFSKAAQLLGLGSKNLWKVPVDERGRMLPSALEALIVLAKKQGARPFFVAGTAGTTVRGAYDPLEKISAIAQQYGLWFHVDGAWGASVLLSPQHKHLMQGAHQADSVVWDAHKMMGMTLTCSLLLVKQRGTMLNTFSTGDTDYIFHASEATPVDLGPATMHCGRRVDGVKLWLAWQHLGDRGWQVMVERYFSFAARAEAIIQAHNSLAMIFPRESVNLCFQYVPTSNHHTANKMTLAIRQQLMEKGLAMVNYAELGGEVFFRLVICNNQTQWKDIHALLQNIVTIGQAIEARTQRHKPAHGRHLPDNQDPKKKAESISYT
ncbi:MAG: aminotransferase class V-fold PLP-dependent enzyme [Cyanobacteria bacterium J06623_4]